MPVVQVSHAPNRAAYDSVVGQLNLDAEPAAGLILHAASETEDGRIQIVDVYESLDALQGFAQTRLFPAFEATGVMDQVRQQEPPVPHEPFHYIS
jgi:hypothetical protein